MGQSERDELSAKVGKGYAARTSKAGNKRDAEQLAEEGMETITLVYRKGATALDGLKDMAKQLRRLPTVDLELPTVGTLLQMPWNLSRCLHLSRRPSCRACTVDLELPTVLRPSAKGVVP